jgi:putative ATP-binding cassette transporter
MRGLGPFLADAWRLSRPYFTSEERVSAWVLLVVIIAMNLLLVAMDVILNFWNGAFYDSLQNKDWRSFLDLLFLYRRTGDGLLGVMPGFCAIAALYIVVAVYKTYLNQWLQIRWRRWMTTRFLDEWLADRAYYRISLVGDANGMGTDNPDQRISEDLRSFTADTLALGLDLLSNVVSLFSFIGVLWGLSGSITLFGVHIGGYMVWVALAYAVVGTVLTHLVGRKLAALSFKQQRVEANFRFALVRLRENVEGVALYNGETEERVGLDGRFGGVIENWWGIMRRTKFLNALTAGYNQAAVVFPIIVAAPRYFSGQIALGGLTRTAGAFGQVQSAMSWFVNSYSSLASWRATVDRLATFHRAIVAARAMSLAGPALAEGAAPVLRLENLTLTLPDGTALLADTDLSVPQGGAVVVSGRSGTGKSTLFRAIAGIWPFGKGVIVRPPGRYLFLPQRPYIPLGTLRHAVIYPADIAEAAQVEAALTQAGLAHLIPRLDTEELWTQVLSGGEQQRLAVARALLLRPDWLFLDEATANLDPESEAEMLRALRTLLPKTTIVAISHRPAAPDGTERRLQFRREAGHAGVLAELPSVASAAE